MRYNLKDDMSVVQSLVFEAYKTSGQIMALLDRPDCCPETLARPLEQLPVQFEETVVAVRNLCERHHLPFVPGGTKQSPPALRTAGRVEVNDYGWLHMALNTLLPHCRYQPPKYLTDTVNRLLDEYERGGRTLPHFGSAALVIDEHCDVDSRQVFDQDNKGWKSIPNAFKGRLIPDDDQFTLSVCLLSTRSGQPTCHIYLIPQIDLGDFFAMRQGDYPMFP